eukprot:COSAG02_NODE_3377_length_6840_cov_2.129061_1_plen_96_part_00
MTGGIEDPVPSNSGPIPRRRSASAQPGRPPQIHQLHAVNTGVIVLTVYLTKNGNTPKSHCAFLACATSSPYPLLYRVISRRAVITVHSGSVRQVE